MSTQGRGRGYTGRHHLRETRPGDQDFNEELEAARTLAELSPRSTEVKMDHITQDMKVKDNVPSEKIEKIPKKDPVETKYPITKEDENVIQELMWIDEQYAPLLLLLEQFSPGEDGIQFNRKLRHFESSVSNLCPDEPRLHQAFASFRAAALMSSVTARKLAAVGASFTRQQRQQLLRRTLLDVVMEGTFSKLDVLERSNPTFLINAANLLGDYFAEARLCNGNKVHILASPLLHYMKALLASDDIRAHRSLATQLMQNGRELLSVLAQELDELSISIRLRLLTPPPVSIIWLLLSADLCLNKFLPLPNTLQQFYASHLDLTTEENYSEVSYGSWKKSPEKVDYNSSDASTEGATEKVGVNLSQISLNHEEGDTMKPKLRPILGAGAAKLRQEQALSISQDNFDTWTPKPNLTQRYDLNSWRENGEEVTKVEEPELVFNPTVLPPSIPPNFPITVPDYPPPNIPRYNNYNQDKPNYVPQETNYLQQGDGTYIQNQYQNNTSFNSQGDGFNPQFTQNPPPPIVIQQKDQPPPPEKLSDSAKTTGSNNRRPVENWRKEKSDLKESDNKNRSRNWTRQRSKDNVTDDEEKEKNGDRRSSSRNSSDSKAVPKLNRRNSTENVDSTKPTPRRHVSDVPRSKKYWDHDDRCDKDYNS